MAEIIPAILSKNYEDLKNKISLVRGIVPIVQIDICDGIFVKATTWPFETKSLDEHFTRIQNEQEGLPFWEDIDFELDLMVHDAVSNFDVYTKLGPRRIIFHIEAVGNLEEFKHFLEGIETYTRDIIEIGVAINPSTDIAQIFPLVNCIDFVQCMGIEHIGLQGEGFSEQCLEQIKKLKEKSSDLVVSVDGGVNSASAPKIIDAGADRLVIGSAIFNTDDILETVEQFKNL
ncbi:MAG: hypothetical protein KGL67_01705 [Patescibacteria group bacterium]|nr:hypothetical protein [Patescibacteria group bacterium]